MTEKQQANPAVGEAIDFLGGDTAVSKKAGLKTAWSVSKWRNQLPADRVLWLAKETDWKFTPHALAPVLYPNESDGLPKAVSLKRRRNDTAVTA